ncbi:MAG: hypothetical protein JO316_13725 [Abitibacteriaceae bacterium]|nr:hypothetical protein [Abditibacteriaceae bacterium]MBV9866407.1 hypothetical protein [Abditibacteriaceae bacterium]
MEMDKSASRVATAIGKGLIAGFVGTVAITASQMIEMKLTGRQPSSAPAEAAGKVFGVKPIDNESKERFSTLVHFGYGTIWGVFRGLLSLVGIRGPVATVLHDLALSGAAMVMLPSLEVAPPVTEQKPKQIATDSIHHVVYAVVAGLIYDALYRADD